MNKELVTYIIAKLKQGNTFESIKDELIKYGWSIDDINAAYKSCISSKKTDAFSFSKIFHSKIPRVMNIFLIFVFLGLFACFFLYFKNPVYSYTINLASVIPGTKTETLNYGEQPALSNPVFFDQVKNQFISDKVNFIEVNLSDMYVKVYKNGDDVLDLPVKTIGREGSWWETPAGLYKIETKEPTHFSSMGNVYMPWSMEFQGNFYIHGIPYFSDGTPVATSYSGGCIRLETDDAKKLYDAVDIGYPILVYKNSFEPDDFQYTEAVPTLSGASSIAVDIGNNYVFSENNPDEVLPIASITKLMTALVTTEYINLDDIATVPQEAIVYTSTPRLKVGEKISVYQLLYPLLMESSNEAAETIARYFGRDDFIADMNAKAASLGMTHTHFADPSGASADNVSTAEDLVTLAKYIYYNRQFILNITSGKINNSAYEPNMFTGMSDFNDFTDNPNFVGGKVGETTAAKETELSIFDLPIANSTSTRPIVIITLGSDNRKSDIQSMLDYISNNFFKK